MDDRQVPKQRRLSGESNQLIARKLEGNTPPTRQQTVNSDILDSYDRQTLAGRRDIMHAGKKRRNTLA